MTSRHAILVLATGLSFVLGQASSAHAGRVPPDAKAAAILATATPGEPLAVVTTTETADGPVFSQQAAGSRPEALDLISEALGDSATDAVGLAHPVSIAATTSERVKRVDDTYRDRQWALNLLQAETVWRKSSGRGVVVAVVDTGVRAHHPDLPGRVLRGWDFVASDHSANDANGHGTHVAGIIAAREDNRRGIAGLAHSAKILPVRVLDSTGNGTTFTLARGIVYAVQKGADVINLSVTSDRPDPQVQAAIRYAVDNDVVVVAAAGNQGCAGPTAYPAAYPGVIGVGAIDRRRHVASFSGCGPSVDVVAPGQQIWSTTAYRPGRGVPCAYGTSYCRLDGTSTAAPHVAAAAAILLSRTKHRMSAAAVGATVMSRSDDLGPPGRDASSGRGVLDVRRMLNGR